LGHTSYYRQYKEKSWKSWIFNNYLEKSRL